MHLSNKNVILHLYQICMHLPTVKLSQMLNDAYLLKISYYMQGAYIKGYTQVDSCDG